MASFASRGANAATTPKPPSAVGIAWVTLTARIGFGDGFQRSRLD